MNGSLCILVRRPPYGQVHAAEAVRHLSGALAEELDVSLLLIDDGVYLARDGQQAGEGGWTPLAPVLARLVAKGAPILVHGPSARARGLLADEAQRSWDAQPSSRDFIPGIRLADDTAVAEALAGAAAVMTY